MTETVRDYIDRSEHPERRYGDITLYMLRAPDEQLAVDKRFGPKYVEYRANQSKTLLEQGALAEVLAADRRIAEDKKDGIDQ